MVTNNASNEATGASGTILRGGGVGTASSYSTSTYPATNAVSTLLYASATNVISALSTANNSLLITGATGVPALGTTLANTFACSISTAGANAEIDILQTDNTNGASNAVCFLRTGGASSGDAMSQYSINGVTTWSLGCDNSDSDAFVISSNGLGTSNSMRIAVTGETTFPLQTCFIANRSATVNNVTGNGANYDVVFDTEIADVNADYNNATGVLTAPVGGYYQLSTNVLLVGCTIAAYLTVLISTSNRNYVSSISRAASSVQFPQQFCVSAADMDAGDTAKITVNATGEAGDTDDLYGDATQTTSFQGRLAQ